MGRPCNALQRENVSILFQSTTYYLRKAEPQDEEFQSRLYFLQQAEMVQSWGWDEDQQKTFLQMQYRARNAGYSMAFPEAINAIICCLDGTAVGRLLTTDTQSDLHIIDIALLPQYQGRGIGSQILTALQRNCAIDGKKISLHVPCDSPAARLYARLGFRLVEQTGVYAQMEWAG